MKRRLLLAAVCIGIVATPGWALLKSKKHEKAKPPFGPRQQQYLDDSFGQLNMELKSLEAQVAALSQSLQTLQQNQAELQSALTHENQTLQDLENKVTSTQLSGENDSMNVFNALQALRNSNETAFSNLKNAISALQAQQADAQQGSGGTGRSSNASAGGGANGNTASSSGSMSTSSTSSAATAGYVINVNGDIITINLGSSNGLSAGSKLNLFAADDSTYSTPVGVVEVTDVIDATDAHVKVDSGNEPKYGDRVKLE